MKCEDALILISGHIDSMNTEDEENALQAHLNGCESCRNILRAYESADDVLSEEVHAPRSLQANVMNKIQKQKAKNNRRPWLSLAVAAALVLVVGLGAVLRQPTAENAPMTVAQIAAARTVDEKVKTDPEVMAQRLVSERGATVAIVQEIYHEIETYECDQIDGYVLYILTDHDMVDYLSKTYGCAVYEPAEASQNVFYAMLAP